MIWGYDLGYDMGRYICVLRRLPSGVLRSVSERKILSILQSVEYYQNLLNTLKYSFFLTHTQTFLYVYTHTPYHTYTHIYHTVYLSIYLSGGRESYHIVSTSSSLPSSSDCDRSGGAGGAGAAVGSVGDATGCAEAEGSG